MKALMMIHGLLSSKKALEFYQKQLEYEYNAVVCYDMPGHGENRLKFTTENIKSFIVDLYDQLSRRYDEIDVLGYSMGGVIACYLQSVRKVRKLILLAPAYRYMNLTNFHFSKFFGSRTSHNLSRKNYLNLIRFTKIISDLSDEFKIIYPETLIIWGTDDFLVKEESGRLLYEMVRNSNKRFLILQYHNHFNIILSLVVLTEIRNFISNE